MGVELRVHCEFPKCEETEIALAHDDDLGSSVTVADLPARRFHFVVDSEWINGPEGWTYGKEGEILCPKHGVVETDGG